MDDHDPIQEAHDAYECSGYLVDEFQLDGSPMNDREQLADALARWHARNENDALSLEWIACVGHYQRLDLDTLGMVGAERFERDLLPQINAFCEELAGDSAGWEV